MRAIIGAGLVVMGTVACGNEDTTPVVPDEMAEMGADNVMFGMRQSLTDEGVRQARVVADTAFLWRDSTAVHLCNPEMTAYYEDGRERAVMTGERGRLDELTDQLHMTGDVVLVVPDAGRRLESEELHYDPQGNRIWSEMDFALYLEDRPDAITGSWFESDLAFENISAGGDEPGDVEGLQDVEPVEPPEEPDTEDGAAPPLRDPSSDGTP